MLMLALTGMVPSPTVTSVLPMTMVNHTIYRAPSRGIVNLIRCVAGAHDPFSPAPFGEQVSPLRSRFFARSVRFLTDDIFSTCSPNIGGKYT